MTKYDKFGILGFNMNTRLIREITGMSSRELKALCKVTSRLRLEKELVDVDAPDRPKAAAQTECDKDSGLCGCETRGAYERRDINGSTGASTSRRVVLKTYEIKDHCNDMLRGRGAPINGIEEMHTKEMVREARAERAKKAEGGKA